MAAISGQAGSVTYAAGYVTNAFKWDIDISAETLPVTPFGATWVSRISGLFDWKGSYECYVDDTTVLPLAGTTGAATFVASGAKQYSGTIITTGIRAGVAADGSGRTITVSFDGNGACTPA